MALAMNNGVNMSDSGMPGQRQPRAGLSDINVWEADIRGRRLSGSRSTPRRSWLD